MKKFSQILIDNNCINPIDGRVDATPNEIKKCFDEYILSMIPVALMTTHPTKISIKHGQLYIEDNKHL